VAKWNREIAVVLIGLAAIYFVLRSILYSSQGTLAGIGLSLMAVVMGIAFIWIRYSRGMYR